MSNEIKTPAELSEQELDVIAGGTGLIFNDPQYVYTNDTTSFNQKNLDVSQFTGATPYGAFTGSQVSAQRINSDASHNLYAQS